MGPNDHAAEPTRPWGGAGFGARVPSPPRARAVQGAEPLWPRDFAQHVFLFLREKTMPFKSANEGFETCAYHRRRKQGLSCNLESKQQAAKHGLSQEAASNPTCSSRRRSGQCAGCATRSP